MLLNKIIVGISGGVDSAVAALLLKQRGLNVHGVFMKNWDEIDENGRCSGEKDWLDAEWVCKKIEIPLTQINFVKKYWNMVFGNFLAEYREGQTPNPDILCNRHIKFDYFYEHAINEMGADAIATGHYARNSFGSSLENYDEQKSAKLLKPTDTFKDQTFFLSQIPQNALRRTIFPLGHLLKEEVKRIAKENGLDRVAQKKESTGICFIGQRNFQEFIAEYVEPKCGDFIDIDTGKIVGQHKGIHNWTVGQRCKISSCLKPYFVLRKDSKTNSIFVASGTDHQSLYSQSMYTSKPVWISNTSPFEKFLEDCEFRFQHTKPLTRCKLFEANRDGHLYIRLESPLRAITPGQYAVIYKGDECLGSAKILSPGPCL